MAFRTAEYEYCIIPFLIFAYYTRADRELLRNVRRVREFCRDLIAERRKNPIPNGHDLLTILLEDEAFKNNDEVMIDECITFFLAGS